jgi:hypothetical protein
MNVKYLVQGGNIINLNLTEENESRQKMNDDRKGVSRQKTMGQVR